MHCGCSLCLCCFYLLGVPWVPPLAETPVEFVRRIQESCPIGVLSSKRPEVSQASSRLCLNPHPHPAPPRGWGSWQWLQIRGFLSGKPV